MYKLLIIDDEVIILENLKFLLELENYEVITTTSSEEGLRIFEEHHNNIDVVISDMKIPKYSGMDVIKRIKQIDPAIEVIILTGHGDMENAIQAIKKGAFDYLNKPPQTDELLIAINNAINKKKLSMENAKMQQQIIEHQKFLQGLHDDAEKILINMLPKKLPEIPGFEFFTEYKSSDAIGGDMYDICDIGDYLCFYVFDVSGHGIVASVISIIIKSFLQNIEYNYIQGINKRRFPEIVVDLNVQLQLNTSQDVFASLFLGFIDKKTKMLYCVSAGHLEQYIVGENGLTPIESTGTLLGLFEDATYTCKPIQLNPKDKIILFTDGITEAASNNGSLYGFERLEMILNNCKNASIKSTITNVMKDVRGFANDTFSDDVTLLGIAVSE